ncbi:MAG: AraC family transcriptional regulator [Spirochaetales bacterium]|nr:AraC family transcriptional regulator [Spirochaetales bacterium]
MPGRDEQTFKGYSLYIPRERIKAEEKHPLLTALIPLETGYFEKAAGHGIRRDALDEYIFLYCTGGKGILETGGRTHSIQKGDLAVCFSGYPHAYFADSSDPWSIYWLHFKGAGVPSLLLTLGLTEESPVLSDDVRGDLIQSFLKIAASFRRGYGFTNLYQSAVFTHDLFSTLLAQRSFCQKQNACLWDLESILEYMYDNIERRLTLEDIAQEAGTSRYHFIRRFKEATGSSPMMYFNQLKIQKACELLDTTSLSIKEISAVLSFNTPYYFSEAFKRIVGSSPEHYRKERFR